MKITTRRRLFYFLLSIFLISSVYVFFYSQGIRFDPAQFAFVETGGLYISTLPDTAIITLDGNHISTENSIFRRGVFVGNLLPGVHTLSIEKEGFSSYEKHISVEKGLVAQATNIILAPTTSRSIGGKPTQGDSDSIIFDEAKHTYFSRDPARGTLLNINLLFTNLKERELGLPGAVPITTVLEHPFNEQKLIIASTGALYVIDIRQLTIELIHKGPSTQIAANDSRLVWSAYDEKTNHTTIFRYDLLLNTIHPLPYTITGKTTELILSPSSQYAALLQSDGSLYLIPFQNEQPTLLARNAANPSFAYTSNRIAFRAEERGTVVVYDISRSTTITLPVSLPYIQDMIWYRDSFHLFVQADDGVYFIDIDDRDPLYAPRIAPRARTILYDLAENVLLIHSAENDEWRAMDFNF